MGGAGRSRRSLLRSIGTGVAVVGLAGTGSGSLPAGRFTVGTVDSTSARAVEALADDPIHCLDFGDIGYAVTGRFSDGILDRVTDWADVRYVEPDGRVRALDHGGGGEPTAESQVVPWGVDRVGATIAHHNGASGSGAGVAILDTGINREHQDLAVLDGEAKVPCESCGSEVPAWSDDNGHGTHVAGTVAAGNNGRGVVGVAPDAALHAVKVLDSTGAGFVADIAAGLEWAADQDDIDVANMSLGGTFRGGALQDACAYAHDEGLLLVAAAGNNTSVIPESVAYPAAYEQVIAVSGTNQSDQLMTTSSSGSPVELAAPGNRILSTVPGGYGEKSGTSMAAPHVAGVGAGVMAELGDNEEARARLQQTAEDLGLDASSQGHGLVDVPVALGVTVAVETLPASDVGESTATLRGAYRGIESVTAGFEHRSSADTDSGWTRVDLGGLAGSGPFSHTLSELESGTTYEYRALVDRGDDDLARGATQTVTPGGGLLGGGGGLLGGGDGGGLIGGGLVGGGDLGLPTESIISL